MNSFSSLERLWVLECSLEIRALGKLHQLKLSVSFFNQEVIAAVVKILQMAAWVSFNLLFLFR